MVRQKVLMEWPAGGFPGPPPGPQRAMPKPYLIQIARASEPLR